MNMTQRKKTNSESSGEGQQKSAFIVTPIGGGNSKTRRATDGLIASALEPVLERHGYSCEASHKDNNQGSISGRIISHLVDDDLVIVNLTDLNANVMYELGVRHSTSKPVILIAENGTELPFDTRDLRTIYYSDDMMGVIELRDQLNVVLGDEEALNSNKYHPIFNALQGDMVQNAFKDKIQKIDLPEGVGGLLEALVSKIDSIEEVVNNFNFGVDRSSRNRAVKTAGQFIKFMESAGFKKFDSVLCNDQFFTDGKELIVRPLSLSESNTIAKYLTEHDIKFKIGKLYETEIYSTALLDYKHISDLDALLMF
ncbi:hypothetical protein [Salinicola sp. MH3R3-1]|uniref:hypothetical protein n=1 Tax=Salinicola sp. MH3R3-1 TaxID=1928762 RepID=UPI0011153F61|nr:hypothetical protein [Salinicola sp. MH3R3-1]